MKHFITIIVKPVIVCLVGNFKLDQRILKSDPDHRKLWVWIVSGHNALHISWISLSRVFGAWGTAVLAIKAVVLNSVDLWVWLGRYSRLAYTHQLNLELANKWGERLVLVIWSQNNWMSVIKVTYCLGWLNARRAQYLLAHHLWIPSLFWSNFAVRNPVVSTCWVLDAYVLVEVVHIVVCVCGDRLEVVLSDVTDLLKANSLNPFCVEFFR